MFSNTVLVVQSFRRVRLFVTPWTVARQAPLSIGFSKQEYWSRLPFSPPGHLSYSGIEPSSLMSPALAGGIFPISATWDALFVKFYQNSEIKNVCIWNNLKYNEL